ncbi:MAG TPA: hypothetical protein VFB67_09215, partial [Candidatus Polarisedimenticolaceae bacterium]|nr:hypothetical protein [Candidatus Polarisedimenticolaceae bacterium]
MSLLLALALASVPAAPAPKTPPAPVPAPARPGLATAAQIEKLTQDGKPDDAIAKGREAVGVRPDDVDLRLALARALGAKARRHNHVVNVKVSQADIAKGQIKVPGANLGDSPLQVGYDAGLFEESILNLDEGIKRAPKRQDLRVLKCFLLTDAGRIDRAKVAIEETLAALPKTPSLAKTMAAYGAERTKRNDPSGGAALMAPVVAAFPSDAAVQADYGNMLTRLGRKSDAYAALDRATQLAPQDVRLARTRAAGAMLLRDYRRAQGAFDATFRLSRGVEDEFASYAAAYGIDPKASAPLMRELGTPSPSSNGAVEELANAFARAGTAGASSAEAIALGKKLVDGKNLLLAIPVLDRAAKADPKNADVRKML